MPAVAPSSLPGVAGGIDRGLDKRVLWIWRVRALLGVAFVATAALLAGAVAAASGVRPAVAALPLVIVLFVGLAVTALVPQAAFARWRFVVGDDWLELRHGVVIRSRSWVPWFRIQHVDVEQGLLERWLGLVHLVVHTASASSDATIPGIPEGDADEVRALIMSRVRSDDGL